MKLPHRNPNQRDRRQAEYSAHRAAYAAAFAAWMTQPVADRVSEKRA